MVCEQKSAIKRIPTENMYIESDMQSFGDEIGKITNKASAMYELMAIFPEDSKEYKELEYRLQCCQKLQQDSIDKSKGIATTPAPSHWFKIDACETDFDRSICVGKKKPYYFIYNYDYVKKKHKVFSERANIMSYIRTGLSVDEVIEMSQGEPLGNINVSRFKNESPVYDNKTVMNKITHKLEEEFKVLMNKRTAYGDFDYRVYMNRYIEIDPDVKKQLEEIYKETKKERVKHHSSKSFFETRKDKDNSKNERYQKLVERFKIKAFQFCNNEDELCNVLVEICYSKKNVSKKFVWDVCGKIMLKNLCENSGNKHYSIVRDNNGELEYCGKKYKVDVVEV